MTKYKFNKHVAQVMIPRPLSFFLSPWQTSLIDWNVFARETEHLSILGMVA